MEEPVAVVLCAAFDDAAAKGLGLTLRGLGERLEGVKRSVLAVGLGRRGMCYGGQLSACGHQA